MGERKWGQSGSNYCHAQPQLQGLVGETKHEKNKELGNSFSLKFPGTPLLKLKRHFLFFASVTDLGKGGCTQWCTMQRRMHPPTKGL